MTFPRQEYWSGLPFPFPGNLPNPGIEPTSPVLAGRFFTTELPGKPSHVITPSNFCEATPCVSISSSVRWQSFLGHRIVVGTIKLSNNGCVWSMVEYQFFPFPFFSHWNFCLAFATPYPSPLLLLLHWPLVPSAWYSCLPVGPPLLPASSKLSPPGPGPRRRTSHQHLPPAPQPGPEPEE